jgi:hypothetical protein
MNGQRLLWVLECFVKYTQGLDVELNPFNDFSIRKKNVLNTLSSSWYLWRYTLHWRESLNNHNKTDN